MPCGGVRAWTFEHGRVFLLAWVWCLRGVGSEGCLFPEKDFNSAQFMLVLPELA